MQALRTPLERLVRELRWFGIATELRALHVHTTPTQRLSVLEHVAAEEHVPGNRRPFLVLEAPMEKATFETASGGWLARAEELVFEHTSVREAAAKAPTPLALPELALDERETSFLTFVATLAALVDGLRDPLEGVVLVLAPTSVEADVSHELRDLIAQPSLARVRWVFVDTTLDASLRTITAPLGELALTVDARVDADEARAEMAARVAQMKSAPAGASSAQLVGGAGPRVAPPPRRNAPPASVNASPNTSPMAELGLATLANPETLRELQIALLEAATATSGGDLEAAIVAHGRAATLAGEHGLVRERLLLELMRAGLLAQGRAFERAIEELSRVRDAALAIDAGDLAVQAQLALAAVWLARSDRALAAAAYAEAGRLGASYENVVLAVEGYRMAGQLLADDGKLDDAARCFQRALEVAESGEPADRTLSTAQDAARTLAALCRQHGLVAQAEALEAQAVRLEAEAVALRKGMN